MIKGTRANKLFHLNWINRTRALRSIAHYTILLRVAVAILRSPPPGYYIDTSDDHLACSPAISRGGRFERLDPAVRSANL